MKKTLRILITIFAMTFIFCAVSSVVFESAENGHDCPGEDCVVCAVLTACESISRHLEAVSGAAAIAVALTRWIVLNQRARSVAEEAPTLVRLKVKLSD